jgi:putative transcriptional regulator
MSELGEMLIQSAQEALAYTKGDKTKGRETLVVVTVPDQIDVKAVRGALGMDRTTFCRTFGFKPRTVIKWERGERQPDGPARAYLTVISKNPKAVQDALAA